MGIEELIGIVFGGYAISFITTYGLRCHIINKNVADFRVMAKRLNFPDEFIEYMEKDFDRKPDKSDYIPGVNVILAIKDLLMRKKEMELLRLDIKHFENEYGPVEQLIAGTSSKEVKIETEYREFFVGYYLDDKPVVIYFYYNGHDGITISNKCAKAYDTLDNQTKMDVLMRILYEIYRGSREYIRSSNIDEVFTDIMVDTLIKTFEEDNRFYDLEQNIESKLIRKKTNDKK